MANIVRGDKYTGLLQVGQRVHSGLYGGRSGVIVEVVGSQMPHTIRSLGGGAVVMGGNANIRVAFEEYETTVPESIVRGCQWDISDEVIDAAGVRAVRLAAAVARDLKEAAEKAKKELQAAEMAALPGRYPHLATGNCSSGVLAGKNIRIELKRAFPAVKFSVRKDYYGTLRVSWIDGPTVEAVEEITGKHEEGSFDGMTDCYEYNDNRLWPRVFGGAKYIFATREYSPVAVAAAIDQVFVDYSFNLAGIDKPTAEDYKRGGCRVLVPGLGNDTVCDLIGRTLREVSCE